MLTGWIDRANSAMIYARKSNQQVLYVLPITSILSKLPLVPVGDTGTIPNSMRGEAADLMVGPVTQSLERGMGAGGGT